MKKSIRKPIGVKKKPIKVNQKGRTSAIKKKNNLIYLKQRYSFHYRKGNWKRAEEYNKYSIENYNINLREWMDRKEISKMKNKNVFGFDKPKKIKYG
tara:strand:+ start:1026 stop:1316 length:291 start_codon:yes stop_codon:yes gene_type:complete